MTSEYDIDSQERALPPKNLMDSESLWEEVVSLYWKEGSSKLGFEDMKKVAKKYVEDGRVGIAKVINGIDLYVCPCSHTIITLLAKYGFFKLSDKTTIDQNKDYLIGCVVWKRNQINHPSVLHQKSSGSSRTSNTSPIELWSPIREQSRKNNPIEVWSPIRTPLESPPKNAPKNYFSALVKSEDTPNVLPSLSVSAELETSNPNLTCVTRPSSVTCDQNFHKRMMEEDMDISPQKKVCRRYENENIHSMEQNFIPPLPLAQILPPFAKQKPDFTYLGPVLMREQTHSHAKPDFTYHAPGFMREQTHARVDSKPDFTYLGPGFMREQAHAQVHKKPTSDVGMMFLRDHVINCNKHFNFSSNLLPPRWNASNQPYQG
ncbi:hypothetical protein KIW84_013588 [Lathyrus oleraceus]|uniref:Spen paralogue and orthologue SPOC C-terminal domain-containing protein n=1 Tax=Pisum sativum TaxID=3888 RepID=A0A9D5BKQ0_PEA|nr:hypothetical protein KIW84_013588 [Pisum sativum]